MMIEILTFGRIAEFVTSGALDIQNIADTHELKIYLEDSFPMLKGIKYKLALNGQVVQALSNLSDNDTVAIMPPFSGG